MRYSETDLQCEDLMWFGADINGCIFACTSGGIGSVPEFVCRSREETELLEEFFMEKMPKTTAGILLIPADGCPLAEDGLLLASKGIFCFDAVTDGEYPDAYKKIARPETPIKISELPEKIKLILDSHIVNTNIADRSFLKIQHAF
ncbi:hypothetical protein IJT93_02790 [bacterium]|nr:hypothetical protein [bacterium]